jgi:signal transduction histidine kinase/CheY-like chemotaxis protein
LLNDVAKITASGDLSHRVPILSKDELGTLGVVFNSMLDNIELKEEAERQYSELVTIINETPLLKELCDSVLEKIISTTDVSFGVFYIVENNHAKTISTYGISRSILDDEKQTNIYSTVIEKQKKEELFFENNPPTIKTGLVEIKIKYLLLIPLVFNKKVIGVIELACEHIPEKTPVNYLMQISEQLAVGLNSALSYEQLENLVDELRVLNEEYQKQNVQISEQNTELIELHKELRKQAEELEEQRKKAVELTHVKSQFLANMSHELRTPLNSIIGLTELISDDISTQPKTKDRLKIVFRNGNKLLAMINNILEFSKIESGKFEIDKSNFVLSEFILDIHNAMEPLVTEKDLEFEINFESDYDLLINTDKHKLEQILLNLLSNAIKFTEVGKIEFTINIVNNVSLQISIVDSGIGIAEEDREIIFNEFEQSDLTRTQKYQGAGLGLAICKKYIELLGGKIYVTSNKYNGSTFNVLLNNIILEKFAIDKNSAIFNVNKGKEDYQKEIILLESDDSNTEKITEYFNSQNYSTNRIDSIGDIPETELQRHYDGIVIDITDKGEDIWKTIHEIKSKFLIPTKIFSSNKNSAFTLGTFNIITENKITEKLKTIIRYTSIITKNINSVCYIGSNEALFRKEIEAIDQTIQFYSGNSFDAIKSFSESKKIDLLISDAVVGNKALLEELENFNLPQPIPKFIYLDQLMVEEASSIIHESFLALSNKSESKVDEILNKIENEFSLIKKVKKSVNSSVENIQIEKTELSIGETSLVDTTKGTFTVLAVDDDKDTLFTVGEILRNIGCEVLFANNGAECLTVLEKVNPDLVLLDIMMPIMDGFETIKKIRTNSDTKELLVYAITAQAMLDDLNIIKNNGFDDLITKPVIASTLSFKIQKAIQKRANKN